ncbi:MAG: phosphoribosylformylglycinamidine synthase subunit PurS [Thermoprotei archaeon]|jgi:phosphoribosylformylglycinamidine (FGAM) synthase PurS component
MRFKVELIITNKEGVRDPEGETLQRYVAEKFSSKFLSTRVGKYVLFEVEGSNKDEAVELVKRLASEKRLYNPLVHKIEVRVVGQDGGH